MKNKKIPLFLIILIVAVAGSAYFYGCKKIDLKRIAYVKTEQAENIFSTSVRATGDIIDLGEGGKVKEYGFCLSYHRVPIIEDKAVPPFENATEVGIYISNISGLTANKQYKLRSYLVDNAGEVVYGNIVEFFTPNSGGSSVWLKYDNGTNVDGIGLVDGGNFDVAIRFTSQQLQQYVGFNVVKFKFFPKVSSPVSYYITLWEGTNPPELIYYEQVSNPDIGHWTEFYPSEIYTIKSGKELWVGYWIVDQPVGLYPAGIDDGPAATGKGDMISFDGGDTWFSMSQENPGTFDFNWNLQVYITNEKGEEVRLLNGDGIQEPREEWEYLPDVKPLDKIVSNKGKENN